MKRKISLLLAALTIVSLAGCANNSQKNVEGKVNILIGNWPDETQADALKHQNELKDEFMKKNTDVNIIPDTYMFDTKTFTMKATAGQLPNLYLVPFTEPKQIIKSGYAADITNAMDKYGYTEGLNPKLLDLVSDNGKLYGVPANAYAQGLYINKKLFKDAGLVNDDGSVMIPDTYEQMAEYAGIIREKTGMAGYVIPTTNNCGGWHFMNIAWSFGVEFMKERSDGTWEATFNTPECVNALQYIKDLKWKYNAFPDDKVIDQKEMQKLFGVGQAAMMFADPPTNSLYSTYGMNIDDVCVASMPAGPAGRYSQLGGGVYMFSKDASEEQIDAGMKWLEFLGLSPEPLTDEQIAAKKDSCKITLEQNGIVLDRNAFQVWVNEDRVNQEKEAVAEYVNINPDDYKDYYEFEGVTLKPEEPQCCQQLYSVLDACIQEVITNENADCTELIKNAANDFQKNHLDKM